MNLLAQSYADVDTKEVTQTAVCLSVVIPIFNESKTLAKVVTEVQALDGIMQVILVNDGSDNATTELVNRLAEWDRVEAIHHEKNLGKGAAVRNGFKRCQGDIVAIQDADLEYDPGQLVRLIEPILNEEADVVYGSRFLEPRQESIPFLRLTANRLLTKLSNYMTGLTLTDMETCYKVMAKEVIEGLTLTENRFGIEPEITAKIAKQGRRIKEIPISYQPRSYSEGKKIGLRDGLRAIWCIWRYSR